MAKSIKKKGISMLVERVGALVIMIAVLIVVLVIIFGLDKVRDIIRQMFGF